MRISLSGARAYLGQSMSPLTGLVPSLSGTDYVVVQEAQYWGIYERTVSWMQFYHFGDVNCEVKGAVLARETVVRVLSWAFCL